MSKIAIVYWSGTGNTEAMAQAIAMGVKKAGGDASVFNVNQFTVDDMADFSGFLFGCPAMGAEELEEAEFEPFFQQAETSVLQRSQIFSRWQESCPLWLLRLGRWRMDEDLAGKDGWHRCKAHRRWPHSRERSNGQR